MSNVPASSGLNTNHRRLDGRGWEISFWDTSGQEDYEHLRSHSYSDADVSAIIHHHGMPRLTEKSIVRPGDLFKELERVRRQGFAIDDEEACMGLRCIAAVVYNDCAEPLAAISVSGMTSRLTDDRLPMLGQTVREVAAELTVALGGVMPAVKAD